MVLLLGWENRIEGRRDTEPKRYGTNRVGSLSGSSIFESGGVRQRVDRSISNLSGQARRSVRR